MIEVDRINDEVFVARDDIVYFGDEEIDFVKQKALASPLKRARICAHKTNTDVLHEMLIAISKTSYIHPHKHMEKSESFHIVEGEVDVVIFDETGAVTDVIEMGVPKSGRQFFYRLSESKYHTLVVRTDILVMHEVTNGPFIKDDSIPAAFAPSASKVAESVNYINGLSAQIFDYLQDS
jgi:cupin fold WbuC family metalloprotein